MYGVRISYIPRASRESVATKLAALAVVNAERKFLFEPDVVVTKNTIAVLFGSGDREKPLLGRMPYTGTSRTDTLDGLITLFDAKRTKGAPTVGSLVGPAYIKALRLRPGEDIRARCADYPQAAGILLDTFVPGVPGGNGEAFDWSLVPEDPGCPISLPGGLTPDNVAAAIRQVRPWAVDVSGGVEARKGIKDAQKLRAFVGAVRACM